MSAFADHARIPRFVVARRNDAGHFWLSGCLSSESQILPDSWSKFLLGNGRVCSLSALGAVLLWKRRSRPPPIFSRRFARRRRPQREELRLQPPKRQRRLLNLLPPPLLLWKLRRNRLLRLPSRDQPPISSRRFVRRRVGPPLRHRQHQRLPLPHLLPRPQRLPVLLPPRVLRNPSRPLRKWSVPLNPAQQPPPPQSSRRLSLLRCRPSRCRLLPRRGLRLQRDEASLAWSPWLAFRSSRWCWVPSFPVRC